MRSPGVLLLLALGAPACTRDEADALCPPVSEGELVVSEVRGEQDDETPPWVELYNASPTGVDLLGTKLRFRSLDGSSEIAVLVRRQVMVDASGYVVLGLTPDNDRPDHIDYGFAVDYKMAWQSSRALDIESCGERIDRAQYSSLPGEGSYALGGEPPNADDNDVPASWCTDPTGSPGAANPACP